MGNEERTPGLSRPGTLKTYAADTGSVGKYSPFGEQQFPDSRFKIPNNFTPARVGQGFMDSQSIPLVSGGEPNLSDLGSRFITKREFPFSQDKSMLPSSKRRAPELNKLFVSNKCSELSNQPGAEHTANQTKYSKEAHGDVFLEEASGSKMSNSRFRIDTEKED